MKKIFKGIRKKEQRKKVFTEYNKSGLALPSGQLNWLDCFASARNDAKDKSVKTLVPECPSA